MKFAVDQSQGKAYLSFAYNRTPERDEGVVGLRCPDMICNPPIRDCSRSHATSITTRSRIPALTLANGNSRGS